MLAAAPSLSTRRHDLDWLRVLAFGLLIFYHSGMFFVSWEWHVKNDVIRPDFEPWMMFPNQWRMSLLFLVSGAAVYFALGRLPARAFAWERVKRLFFPLLFGMLLVVPPQIYAERLTQGYGQSYWDFQQSVFALQPYPAGNFSWHHLWYLIYVLVYSLLFLPLFGWLRSPRGEAAMAWVGKLLSKPAVLYGFALVQFADEVLLKDRWEITHNLIEDWYNHGLSAGFFVMGFLLAGSSGCWRVIEQRRKLSLGLGLAAAALLYGFYWLPWSDLAGAELVGYRLLKSINRWCWMLAILGYASRYLRFDSPFLRYATPAVYPFYILHQSVIVVIAYVSMHWAWNPVIKFGFIVLTTFLTCGLLYEFAIRRVNPLRFAFGMKPLQRPQKAASNVSTPSRAATRTGASRANPTLVE